MALLWTISHEEKGSVEVALKEAAILKDRGSFGIVDDSRIYR